MDQFKRYLSDQSTKNQIETLKITINGLNKIEKKNKAIKELKRMKKYIEFDLYFRNEMKL